MSIPRLWPGASYVGHYRRENYHIQAVILILAVCLMLTSKSSHNIIKRYTFYTSGYHFTSFNHCHHGEVVCSARNQISDIDKCAVVWCGHVPDYYVRIISSSSYSFIMTNREVNNQWRFPGDLNPGSTNSF